MQELSITSHWPQFSLKFVSPSFLSHCTVLSQPICNQYAESRPCSTQGSAVSAASAIRREGGQPPKVGSQVGSQAGPRVVLPIMEDLALQLDQTAEITQLAPTLVPAVAGLVTEPPPAPATTLPADASPATAASLVAGVHSASATNHANAANGANTANAAIADIPTAEILANGHYVFRSGHHPYPSHRMPSHTLPHTLPHHFSHRFAPERTHITRSLPFTQFFQ